PILAVGLAAAWQIRRLAGLTRAALLVTFTGVVVVLYDGGDWMRHGRLLSPFVPMIAMACVPGLMALFFRPMDVGRTLLVGPARRLVWLFVIGFGAIQILFWQEALRHPPFPMSVVTETTQIFAGVGPAMCGEPGLAVASPDVGGLLYDDPMHRVTDLAGITDAEAARAGGRSYWVERLARDRPQLVLVHGVWVPRTGLDDGAMVEAGYRLLCRRSGTPGPSETRFPPSVYRRLDCDRPVPPDAMDALDAWCARPR
ncbi:MAG: hypothetical protein JRJ84_18500, partial [Deltaproteobacteria bacterium]|nr:hypothetical protein [Deltaproteobacteria bacterium]